MSERTLESGETDPAVVAPVDNATERPRALESTCPSCLHLQSTTATALARGRELEDNLRLAQGYHKAAEASLARAEQEREAERSYSQRTLLLWREQDDALQRIFGATGIDGTVTCPADVAEYVEQLLADNAKNLAAALQAASETRRSLLALVESLKIAWETYDAACRRDYGHPALAMDNCGRAGAELNGLQDAIVRVVPELVSLLVVEAQEEQVQKEQGDTRVDGSTQPATQRATASTD